MNKPKFIIGISAFSFAMNWLLYLGEGWQVQVVAGIAATCVTWLFIGFVNWLAK